MLRNAVLVISTLGVLAVLYIAYSAAFVSPMPNLDRAESNLPTSRPVQPSEVIRIADVELAPGEAVAFTTYDPKTGRPTGNVRCATWKLMPGSKNNVDVTEPEISILMPSGMICIVSAKKGQLYGDRVKNRQMEPKRGWLEGDATILIDRDTSADRTPLEARPWDEITIRMDRLEFDFDQGRLETTGPASVQSDFFGVSTVGLKFVWNQGANRVDLLEMQHGGELTLYMPERSAAPAASQPTSDVAQAATSVPIIASKPRKQRRPTTYLCTLDGGILADQFERGRRSGGLEAETLSMLFDVGAGVDDLFEETRKPTRERNDRRQDANRSRLVVRFGGALRLSPINTPLKLEQARRQIVAEGPEVKLDLDDRCIVASKLTYHDEAQRLWLTPLPGRALEMQLGSQGLVRAESLYADLKQRLVKLVGNVVLDTRDARGSGASIRCDLWAELRLRAAESATGEQQQQRSPMAGVGSIGGIGALESALFVGSAHIDLDGQSLRANRLETFFRPPAADEPLQASLDLAIASDGVVLSGGDGGASWSELLLGQLQRPLISWGSVRRQIEGGREQSLRAAWLAVNFARGSDGRVYASELDAIGPVRMRDIRQNVLATARSMFAVLREGGQIDHAFLRGDEGRSARLRADTFAIRGRELLFRPETQTMSVDGPSLVDITSNRSLRGEQRSRPTPIRVRSEQRMSVDGLGNEVLFIGNVDATSEGERLQGESLRLTLVDVVEPPKRPGAFAVANESMKRVFTPREQRPAKPTGQSIAFGGSRTNRKEVTTAIATNALVSSEVYVAGDPQPMLHQSITAPELHMNMRQRQIQTVGATSLIMIDRRTDTDVSAAAASSGLPSALVTRGANQTLLQCQRSMTYSLGADGPERRDTVLFDGDVALNHVAGRDMINLDKMLPQLASDPPALAKLKSRSTQLRSNRLECAFSFGEATGERARAAGMPAVRLSWLAASENVYLRDKQGPWMREIFAHQLEFDRPSSKIRVFGSEDLKLDARVYSTNSETGASDEPFVGRSAIIDLESNALRTGPATGEIRRN